MQQLSRDCTDGDGDGACDDGGAGSLRQIPRLRRHWDYDRPVGVMRWRGEAKGVQIRQQKIRPGVAYVLNTT